MTKPTKCAPSEDSDQPGHLPSLIRVFAVRMKKAWVPSYPLSAQRRLIRLGRCPGWSESLLGAQSLCWFCHVWPVFFLLKTDSYFQTYAGPFLKWNWNLVSSNHEKHLSEGLDILVYWLGMRCRLPDYPLGQIPWNFDMSYGPLHFSAMFCIERFFAIYLKHYLS